MSREINLVVIHCSASPNGGDLSRRDERGVIVRTPADEINEWHRKRGFQRPAVWRRQLNPQLDAIGYHVVIGVNGAHYTGRHLDEIGAHVFGFNRASVGVCMVGTDRFTAAQWERLRLTITALQVRYPAATITGHRDLSPDQNGDGIVEPWEWLKTCPGFDVTAWLARKMIPDPAAFLGEVKR